MAFHPRPQIASDLGRNITRSSNLDPKSQAIPERERHFRLMATDSNRNGPQPTPILGHAPTTAGTFRKKFRKDSGKTPETLSERFLQFPSRVRLGCPKPYNSRHLRLPERFQNSLPAGTAGDASFFRIGSGEGLSELVMEFPAVLGAFLRFENRTPNPPLYSWSFALGVSKRGFLRGGGGEISIIGVGARTGCNN